MGRMETFGLERENFADADDYERWRRRMQVDSPDGNGSGEELLRYLLYFIHFFTELLR